MALVAVGWNRATAISLGEWDEAKTADTPSEPSIVKCQVHKSKSRQAADKTSRPMATTTQKTTHTYNSIRY